MRTVSESIRNTLASEQKCCTTAFLVSWSTTSPPTGNCIHRHNCTVVKHDGSAVKQSACSPHPPTFFTTFLLGPCGLRKAQFEVSQCCRLPPILEEDESQLSTPTVATATNDSASLPHPPSESHADHVFGVVRAQTTRPISLGAVAYRGPPPPPSPTLTISGFYLTGGVCAYSFIPSFLSVTKIATAYTMQSHSVRCLSCPPLTTLHCLGEPTVHFTSHEPPSMQAGDAFVVCGRSGEPGKIKALPPPVCTPAPIVL